MIFHGLLERHSILAFLFKLFDANNKILSQMGWEIIFISAKTCPSKLQHVNGHLFELCMFQMCMHTHTMPIVIFS